MATTSVPATDPVAARSIETAMRRTLLDSMVASPYAVDAIWLVVMVSIWSSVPAPRALVLTIAYGIVAAIRYAFHFLYVRRKPADDRLDAWGLRVYAMISIGIGLGWTAQTLVLLGTEPSFVWVLPLVALGVMTVNSAHARSLHVTTALSFVVPALLPQAIALALQTDVIARGLGIGNLAYLVALALWTRGLNRRLRERFTIEAELRDTLARNAELQDELERGRQTLNTVLDNLDDGVELYDSQDRRVFGNAAIRRLHDIPEDVYEGARTARDMIAWRTARGEFGSHADTEAEIDRRTAVLRDPAAAVIQRPTVTGRTVELRFKQLPNGGVLSMHRDITRLKAREEELATAKEEAEMSRLAAETAQTTMRTVLDAMDDGVILIDRTGHWRYTNRAIRDVYQVDEAALARLPTLRDIFLYQARRGDYGPLKDPEASMDRLLERFWRGEAARVGRTVTGRWLDYRYHPLPDGSMVMTHRDVTDMKRHEDELAAAKEEADRARAETAQALERLQVVIDNMSDGVMLFDSELRWAIDNAKVRDLLALPAEVAYVGARSEDIQRFQIARGDFGVIEDVDADIRDWLARRKAAGVMSYTRWTPAGRFIEYHSKPLANGEIVATYRDITDLKRNEAAAEEAHNRLEDAIRALPSAFSLHDSEGRLIVYNDPYERFFGNTAGILKRGERYEDLLRDMQRRGLVRPEHRERGEAWVAEMAAHHRSSFGDREMATADDSWIRISKHPTRDGGVVTLVTDLTESKQRERELARARADAEQALSTARTIIETMPIGAALVGPDNRVRFANRRLPGLLGFAEELAAEGRPYIDAIRDLWERSDFKDDLSVDDRARDLFARIRAEREVRYERHLPNSRDIDFRFTALPDGGFLGTYVDITEAKHQQAALAQALDEASKARALLQDAVDSTPDGFALWDEEDRLIVCNEGYRRYYSGVPVTVEPGRGFSEILGAGFDSGLFVDATGDREAFIAATLRTRRNPGLAPREHRLRSDLSLQVIDRRTASGGLVSVYADISEQKRRQRDVEQARDAAEAAGRDAANARARLVDAIEAMPNGFVLADANGRVVIANQRFHEYYAPIADIIVPGADMRWTLAEAARRGAVPTDGKSIEDWVEARMAMRANPGPPRETRQPDGRWLVIAERRTREGGYASMYTDISELKRREAELELARDEAEAANQAKSTFLATMSHEIRTPMNGVLGMMEILERQGIDEEQQSTVETMRESAQALLRIIDDVLDFSKIEAGRLELESTSFSLSGVIEGAMAALRPQASEKSLPLSADIDPGSSDALEGDPVRVRQILINLLGNAVKFTERGFVRVAASTAPLGDGRIRVSLSVADSGIGMDDAQLARLFEPFAQADSSTTRRYGGTGLGLSIVRRLAQLMEGDATVESKPGVGTTFRITLVLSAAPADSPLRAIAPITTRVRRRLPAEGAARVLVVDDHPVNLKVLVKQLEMLGVATETAVDGVEALAMWRMGNYAAVLADIHMPRMDGYELAGSIRREERDAPDSTRRTPLIAVTANAMRGEEERCLAAGMDAYLAKPVTFERLRAALSRWLPLEPDEHDTTIAGETPAIDESTLRAWLGDDPEAVAELLQDFLRDARQAERDIGASLSAGNLPSLAATAHRLKGSALAIGARRLGDIAAGLEQAGRIGDRAACQDGLGALAGELRRVAGKIGT